jgi:uncharacterized protein
VNATLLLVIASLALVVGPLLDRVGRRWPGLAAAIDGATVGGIVVVVFVHLLPEAGAHLSWWTLVLFGFGLALPTLGERLMHVHAQGWRFSLGGLVIVLLLLHEVIESAALASRAYDERISIATLLVIVGHRLPLGLFVWGQARRRFGLFWSVTALAFLASASFAGPLLVPERFREGEFSAVLSALLAGGLLHLVLQHRPSLGAIEEKPHLRHAWSAAGTLLAVAFFVPYLLGVDPDHSHGQEAALFPQRLWELVQETSLPLLIGVLGAGLVEAFLPGTLGAWFQRGTRLRQALAGMAAGAPMPMCSCGVLPVYRSLIHKGVPPTAGLAFLIAAPEIGVDSILLSIPMLGLPTTAARLLCALILALVVGLVVGRFAEPDLPHADHRHPPEPKVPPLVALRRGLFETWSHLAPWILFGLAVTALVEPWISSDWSRALPPWLQVIALSLAGMPTYICATAATPFAALLLIKGFSPGAVIAFLLVGPATNVTTFGALRRIHSRRLAVAFAAVALGTTLVLGWSVDALWGVLGPGTTTSAALDLAQDEHAHGPVHMAATIALGLLSLWVLVRSGPRAFLAQLWPEGSPGREAHGHDHAVPGEVQAASAGVR